MYTTNGFETGRRIIQKSKSPLLSSVQAGDVPILPVVKRGKGPYLYDYDKNRYVDFFLARGSLVFGHAHPGITTVMKSWINKGYAGGYPTVSHGMLASRMDAVLLMNRSPQDSIGTWLFFNSSFDAGSTLLDLLHVLGMKAVYICDENKNMRSWSRGLSQMPIEDADARTLQSVDCLILRYSRHVSGSAALDLLKIGKSLGKIIITDETELTSFIHASALNLAGESDIRVFGTWLSGGIDFGVINLKKDTLPNSDAALKYIATKHSGIAFPALYKIKTAFRFLKLVESAGGFAALQEKHERFASMLDPSFFETVDGFSFSTAQNGEYPSLHAQLLQLGVLFPIDQVDPLFVSFAHNGDLLKKNAAVINTFLTHFFDKNL